MSEYTKSTPITEDELTLKSIILQLLDYYREIVRNWMLVAVVTIPLIIFFLYRAFTTPPIYTADLTFMVNEDEGGGIGGAAAILSQFGFGGRGGKGAHNVQKILALSKTRKIIQRTLFEKCTINGRTDYIANHIIDIYDFHKKWKKSTSLKGFYFKHKNTSSFNIPENAALKSLQSLILGNRKQKGLYSTGTNEETGIMTLGITSLSDQLSINWLNFTYTHLSQYYRDQSIEKQQATFDLVKEKVDSVRNALNAAELRLAKLKDSNRGIWTKTAEIEQVRTSRNVQLLTITYGEAIKNKEIADFSLRNKTPFIQLIDAPIAPIPAVRISKIIALIKGGILGCLLTFTFLIGRKIIRDVMGVNALE